jgi:hypothetical protein
MGTSGLVPCVNVKMTRTTRRGPIFRPGMHLEISQCQDQLL